MYFARILALRDLDQTGKNGFHANPNFNKICSVKNYDKDLDSQQYFCMSDLRLDFKGPIFKGIVLRDLDLRDLDLRDLDFKDLVLRNSDLRDFYIQKT
jgi:uncharacterized protein YjbI with pentapeptide repeats